MEIRTPQNELEWELYYNLRWEVLRKPWNQPKGSEKDSDEDLFFHIAAFDNGDVTGVGCMKLINDKEAQIRFMAVSDNVQRKGVGVSLMNGLEAEASRRGLTKIILHAREIAVPFYIHCGYKHVEKSYLLFDSIQHYLMEKEI